MNWNNPAEYSALFRATHLDRRAMIERAQIEPPRSRWSRFVSWLRGKALRA